MKRWISNLRKEEALKSALGGLLGGSPFTSLLRLTRRRHANYVKSLMYHNISTKAIETFSAQLRYIKDYCGFIEPSQLQAYCEGGQAFGGIRALLTFDDGFKSHYRVAKEILKPLGIKAIFFVPSPLVELNSRSERRRYIADRIYKNRSLASLSDDIDLMNPDDLQYLISEGHVIGAHTRNHRALSEIRDVENLREEIVGSGDALEQHLGIGIDWFAYPLGPLTYINGAAYRIIRERYRFCCSGVRGLNGPGFDPYCILRDPVDVKWSNSFLRFLLSDGLGFLYWRRAKKLRQIAYLQQ